MRIVKAKVKTTHLDGLDFLDDGKLGKVYDVDLDRIVVIKWSRAEQSSKMWDRKSIWVLPGGFMPIDLFELEQDA